MLIGEIDCNVTLLTVQKRPALGNERVFSTVPTTSCWHKRYLIDEKSAEVT